MSERVPAAYEVGRLGKAVLDTVGSVVVGKRDALELVLAGILAGGHVLLEDLPGLGKTLTARSFAQALGIDFRRLQFTPDLLPADVTGSFLYDQRNHDFTFRPGPVFTNVLLADEINRTPPKTQSALLEAMQEKQVSVEGTTYRLKAPFHVLATANPIEYEGTYPLPEAQLDRFLLRVSFGYPNREEELEVLRRRIARREEAAVLPAVVDADTLVAMQDALEDVTVEDSIGRYLVELATATREHPSVLVGASPRGSLALLLLSRAKAALAGRDYVVPEDVKAVAIPALAHRITLKPEMGRRPGWPDRTASRPPAGDRPAPPGTDMTTTLPALRSGAPVPEHRPAPRRAHTPEPRRHAVAPWNPTRAFARAVGITGGLLLAAIVLGRADLVVLAVPFALGAALAFWRRPQRPPLIGLDTGTDALAEGREVKLRVTVGNPGDVPVELLVLRTAVSAYTELPDADRPHLVNVAARSGVALEFSGHALRWGQLPFGPAVAHAVAADGLLVSDAAVARAAWRKVYPVTEDFDADDAMPRAAGLIGVHRSRRTGEGGELAGVRAFAPGDRLRRVDWRITLRTGQLHVAQVLSERDAEVLIILDVLHEAGRSGGIHGAASVLDTTVRAAAGIAEHYLHRGDRVALLEYGYRARRLRAAAGRRQYLTVLEWLLEVDATAGAYEPPPYAFGADQISPNALVVVLSPLIDERSAQMLARLARSGRFVVAVDTLPAGASVPPDEHFGGLPARLWRLERENLVGLLSEQGVPVVPWAGANSIDLVLRQVARLAGAPRVGRR
jgi:MoxR-like ATPase/uncharacterized protein (DUF58 family)